MMIGSLLLVALATMKSAIVIIDPVTEWNPVVKAAKQKELVVIVVQLSPIEDRMKKFLPTPEALAEAGVDHVFNLQDRDCYNCVHMLKLLETNENLKIQAIIPLAETAVDYSDVIAAMVGLKHHNPLHLATSRRDKGFMKEAVRDSGVRIAAFSRIRAASEIEHAIKDLQLTLPVVVKTPQGFSTTDVFICQTLNEATEAASKILHSVGPEGRRVSHALIEEYIGGTEFAVNMMASEGKLMVTDVWKYIKTDKARYSQADICDPNDPLLENIVDYSRQVANAVGLKYGAGHVEVKAKEDTDGVYVDPRMMEVGARLSGGRKSTMAQAAMKGAWDPFSALIDYHSGLQPTVPESFTPKSFVRHVFLPIEKSGKVEDVQLETSGLTTLHSQAMIIKKGDAVKETTDITSCAGFLWLVGARHDVDRDTETALSSFKVVIN
jgi:hypothetical protein